MSEDRIKILEKIEKKLSGEIDTLDLLIDAESYQIVQSGSATGAVTQMSSAKEEVLRAVYFVAEAIAIAKGDVCDGQTRMED